MMRVTTILLILLAFQLEAQQSSLSHSVNQAKTQGKVLSAKTKNGQHVVKVLTNDGKIKTITQPVSKARSGEQGKYFKQSRHQDEKNKDRSQFKNRRNNSAQKNNKSHHSDRKSGYSNRSKSNKFNGSNGGSRNKSKNGYKDQRSTGRNKNEKER